MSKRIIAIDPGEATGYAIGRIDKKAKEFQIETWGHDPWRVFSMNYMNVMLGDNPFEIVVYESWRLRPEAAKPLIGSDFPAVQGIGVIKYGAWHRKAELCTTEPSYKPIIDKQMGGKDYLPERDTVEHYRDAFRHLCWYAVNSAGIGPEAVRMEALRARGAGAG